MLETLSRRALVGVAALVFVAGCSTSSNSLTPGSPSSLGSQSVHVPPGMRLLPGPAVVGPVLVSLHPHPSNLPHVWPDRHHHHKQILFASDSGNNSVYMYNPGTVNGSPKGSITTGINVPFGLAVDKSSTLYVANLGGNTVTIYPKGQTSPSLTISTGISGPYGIGVDSSGDVFVSNLNTNNITAYKAGQTSPYETINFNTEGQAVGLAVDGNDNVWVACDTTSAVFEIPKGSTSPKNAGLSGLNGPIGISFGKTDQMFVSNFGGSNVQVYAYGTTSPSETITTGIESFGPVLNGITHSDYFFQSNQDDNIVGYKPGQTSPFSTLAGDSSPTGIAATPEVVK
jgi:hypothetical protein